MCADWSWLRVLRVEVVDESGDEDAGDGQELDSAAQARA